MGFFDKFGKNKKYQGPIRQKPASIEAATKKPEKAVAADETAAAPAKTDTGRAYQILFRPILSEKGTHLTNLGKYVFAVHPNANKSEIKKSIQTVYDVHVRSVHIVKMPGKSRRFGRSIGRTANWKKAIVTVKAGEKIPGIIESVG